MFMSKIIKVLTKYFFGIGYTMINDDKVLEVRSISSEMIEEGKESRRSYNPTILKSELREVGLSTLDDETVLQVSRDIYYREWILDETDIQSFLQNDNLLSIPLSKITAFPQRPPMK